MLKGNGFCRNGGRGGGLGLKDWNHACENAGGGGGGDGGVSAIVNDSIRGV